MALAIDKTTGHGLSNEAHHKLLSKKSKVILYLPFIHSKSLLTIRSASVLKLGVPCASVVLCDIGNISCIVT